MKNALKKYSGSSKKNEKLKNLLKNRCDPSKKKWETEKFPSKALRSF